MINPNLDKVIFTISGLTTQVRIYCSVAVVVKGLQHRSFTNSLPESEDPFEKTRKFSTEVMKMEILRAHKILDALNVFELFSSKKILFIFGFFL